MVTIRVVYAFCTVDGGAGRTAWGIPIALTFRGESARCRLQGTGLASTFDFLLLHAIQAVDTHFRFDAADSLSDPLVLVLRLVSDDPASAAALGLPVLEPSTFEFCSIAMHALWGMLVEHLWACLTLEFCCGY